MYRSILAVGATVSLSTILAAQSPAGTPAAPDTTPKITFGGFVDGYYAFDFNRPANFDRPYTTQAARHNEFNVNLAYVEAKLDAPTIRGRLAIQAGTSVQNNYAGEPRNGSVSGPDLARLLQEAFVGVKLADNLWVDGGIFFAHTGMESFISRDNLAYTRSLAGDYSPFYLSGAKLTWQAAPTVSAQLLVVNGWQNISESNAAKSVGVRLDYTPSATTTLSYFNYLGNEAPDSATNDQMRFFNGVGVKTNLTPRLQMLAEVDYGTQGHASGSGSSSWYGAQLTARDQVTPIAAVVGRVERYQDGDQVIIVTRLADGFRANSASIGVDITPQPRVLWRTELRGYQGDNAVFPKRSGGLSRSDALIVTSLGLTF